MRTIINTLKKKFIIIPLVLGITSFTVFNYVFNKNELILDILVGGLTQNHYSPVKLDDVFSEKVFDLYIKRTDASKKFFLQEDIDLLSKYKRSIDDQLKNQSHDFYKISVDLIAKRIKEKESWYKEYLSKPLEFASEETYESDAEKSGYAKTPEELKKEWQTRFPQDSFSYMPNPHNLQRYNVMLRYMASKGLNKDSAGLTRLNEEDLKNIQKNITNYKYPEWSFLHKRIYEFVWEYDEFKNERNINGHSLTMRLYFWKASSALIKENVLFGVGTGDVQNELNKTYIETNSPLDKDWYKRPHNQFLTITVALGILGLVIFLISFLYPIISLKKQLHSLFWPYFLIVCLSFVLEDTLETQAGLSFYAFFFTLFITQAFFKKQQNLAD